MKILLICSLILTSSVSFASKGCHKNLKAFFTKTNFITKLKAKLPKINLDDSVFNSKESFDYQKSHQLSKDFFERISFIESSSLTNNFKNTANQSIESQVAFIDALTQYVLKKNKIDIPEFNQALKLKGAELQKRLLSVSKKKGILNSLDSILEGYLLGNYKVYESLTGNAFDKEKLELTIKKQVKALIAINDVKFLIKKLDIELISQQQGEFKTLFKNLVQSAQEIKNKLFSPLNFIPFREAIVSSKLAPTIKLSLSYANTTLFSMMNFTMMKLFGAPLYLSFPAKELMKNKKLSTYIQSLLEKPEMILGEESLTDFVLKEKAGLINSYVYYNKARKAYPYMVGALFVGSYAYSSIVGQKGKNLNEDLPQIVVEQTPKDVTATLAGVYCKAYTCRENKMPSRKREQVLESLSSYEQFKSVKDLLELQIRLARKDNEPQEQYEDRLRKEIESID